MLNARVLPFFLWLASDNALTIWEMENRGYR